MNWMELWQRDRPKGGKGWTEGGRSEKLYWWNGSCFSNLLPAHLFWNRLLLIQVGGAIYIFTVYSNFACFYSISCMWSVRIELELCRSCVMFWIWWIWWTEVFFACLIAGFLGLVVAGLHDMIKSLGPRFVGGLDQKDLANWMCVNSGHDCLPIFGGIYDLWFGIDRVHPHLTTTYTHTQTSSMEPTIIWWWFVDGFILSFSHSSGLLVALGLR